MGQNRQAQYLLGFIITGLVYGTLFPLTDWHTDNIQPLTALMAGKINLSFGDVVVNVLVYMPLGFAAAMAFVKHSIFRRVVFATLVGAILSFTLELLQAFLPSRVSSLSDLALNAFGAFCGAVIACSLAKEAYVGRWLRHLDELYVRPDPLAKLGIAIAALWMSTQLLPFVPSFDVGNLRSGIKLVFQVFSTETSFTVWRACGYGLTAYILSWIGHESLRQGTSRSRNLFLFFCAVLFLKVLVVGRQLSAEAILGVAAGYAIHRIVRISLKDRYAISILFAIIGLVAISGLHEGSRPIVGDNAFIWVPFKGQLSNDLIGIADLLERLWPMAAIVWWQLKYTNLKPAQSRLVGSLVIAIGIFAIEWRQTSLMGRLGDITDVLISVIAYWMAWYFITQMKSTESGERSHNDKRRRRKRTSKHSFASKVITSYLTLFLVFALGTYLSGLKPAPVEERVVENTKALLAPEDLPPVSLPNFRYAHPRLPHPTPEDIARIEKEEPGYIKGQLRFAKEGKGRSHSIVMSELFRPNSQDLLPLYEKLLNLEFTWRGNTQVKPLVKAYDWLYHMWTPEQRAQLLAKTVDGCEFIVNAIREKTLSPYNVYLYNSPMQALMACAIATYGEEPRAEHVMRFTADMWQNKIQPVWQQIMGRAGGWHEGGEYVGIGIGRAIYQLPHMWQHATGEDAFESIPGIKGFLDFLVYRTRPDGTHFRWGDTAFVDKRPPDAKALAVKFNHKAAYTLAGCPNRLVSGAWPWGHLHDFDLCDETAIEELPWFKLFDGLGLLVARSSWENDATYVTFKAGDNYWSHTHLDQGAFTIFKHRALAIDSGLYGGGYGSDHHMNYTYQTIAHNTITVTDPQDTLPSNKDGKFRTFANDGGQRRIGSGWGVESAPLDLDEWLRKKDIYETGDILEFIETDNYVSVLSDITAAYTNQLSGKGTFSHRTLRVKKIQRRFLYDRELDMIAVFDSLQLEKSQFTPRWNLHSIGRPFRTKFGFEFEIKERYENSYVQRTIAGLTGHVVLPESRYLNFIGGPNMAFFVDGINYDDDGAVQKIAAKKTLIEPGEWRMEIIPEDNHKEVKFLVLLFPWLEESSRKDRVSCSTETDIIDCEIEGETARASYRFNRNNLQITVEHL